MASPIIAARQTYKAYFAVVVLFLFVLMLYSERNFDLLGNFKSEGVDRCREDSNEEIGVILPIIGGGACRLDETKNREVCDGSRSCEPFCVILFGR